MIVCYEGEGHKKMKTMMYYGNNDYTLGVRKNEQRIKIEKLLPDETLVLKENKNSLFNFPNKKNFALKDDEDLDGDKI